MDSVGDITVLSLCTGYGGLDIGLSRAIQRPMRIVAVEVEAYALANLVEKTEQGKMAIEACWPDLKTFPAKEFSGCFDIITAGYPCQPFSVAGKQKGTKDERHLWPFIRDIIEEVDPFLVWLENVAGHLSIGFDTVVGDLDELGYTVEAGLFTAAEVGAPHKRERLFILANSSGVGRRGWDNGEPGGQGRPLQTPGPGELADTTAQRIQRSEPKRATQAGRQIDEYGRIYWPARPGQDQYEWEEPRTIVDNPLCRRHISQEEQIRTGGDSTLDTDQREIKPSVGRAANGPSHRVDRLRLLGNGVVPAQAELAFRTLMERL